MAENGGNELVFRPGFLEEVGQFAEYLEFDVYLLTPENEEREWSVTCTGKDERGNEFTEPLISDVDREIRSDPDILWTHILRGIPEGAELISIVNPQASPEKALCVVHRDHLSSLAQTGLDVVFAH
jgi:hypothetical protein